LKFKSIFALFNAVVGISFLFVFAMPFFALGFEYAGTFWASNWPLAMALVVVLLAIDGFFIVNWRLFTLLEREDWPALAHHLEERVVKKGQWSSRLVRLLANTYLVLSDASAVAALETKIAAAKPVLIDKNALVFGVARVLANNPEGSVSFFAARRASKKTESPEWIEWYYAFSLLLSRNFEVAADVLLPLSSSAKDAIVVALSASFLGDSVARALPGRSTELGAAAEAARARVLKRLPTQAAWDKEVERARADIHAVVLSKSIDEAAKELYGAEGGK
jgi:hypothetical protein